MIVLDITLPGLPPTNTADRRSPFVYHALSKRWKKRVTVAVLEALKRWPSQPLDRARVTIVRRSTREPDFDGLVHGGKFLLDGLVLAGVIVDDKPSVIGQPVYRWEPAKRGQGGVQIVVESVDSGVEIGPRIMTSPWLDGTGGEGA